MNVLICGDRNWTDQETIRQRMSKLPPNTTIIEGEARGADTIARDLAIEMGFTVLSFPANWEEYGQAAGVIRNTKMLIEGKPDIVIAFHPNITKSKGTKDMVTKAKRAHVPVEVITGR